LRHCLVGILNNSSYLEETHTCRGCPVKAKKYTKYWIMVNEKLDQFFWLLKVNLIKWLNIRVKYKRRHIMWA